MIEYRRNFPLDAAQVAAVFDASGIRRPTGDLARIARMFANANLVFSAWHEDRLAGGCRALTDFSYCCYLSDLAVDRGSLGRQPCTEQSLTPAQGRHTPHMASAA